VPRKVATDTGIIDIGASDKLPAQVEFTYGTASEALHLVTQLEEQVEALRELVIELGGPAYAERLERYINP
jgi:hypothetical protein